MTETERTQFRAALLLQMHAQHPEPITVGTLHTGVTLAGFRVNITELRSELQALAEEGLAKEMPEPLNKAVVRYIGTEAGRVLLVQANLLP